MNKRTQDLYHSLVGSSIEFSFKKKLDSALSIEQNIQREKERISKNVDEALSVGGELCVMLLAELTNFYRKEIYYMAVRSSIRMNRYRPLVLDYLRLDVEERIKRLREVLSEKLKGDKHRALKVSITRYFLRTYPNRTTEFKKLLTREEFMSVI